MDKNKYINILVDSLEKKLSVLDDILHKNDEQNIMITMESFDMQAFDRVVLEKAALLEKLDLLDAGFEGIYEKIKNELVQGKELYKNEIFRMQSLIAIITDKSIQIQTTEERNKKKIEDYFRNTHSEYKRVRATTKAASTYYKAMSRLNTIDPQLIDRKK